jgi:predicted AlkP superfamily phosphohydrolase/phosphomutase
MADIPNKVAVLGLDCALPALIEKHIAEGYLPTFKKLLDAGVICDNCLVPYPTITPPNWASIATGTWPGTHGITDFHAHIPGTTPIGPNTVQALSSERFQAETLWDAADKAGKKCIVMNYPGAWPSHMKNGIMVGGGGLSIGEDREGEPGMRLKAHLCTEQLIATGIYPNSIRGKFIPAKEWKNLPKKESDPLELEAVMTFQGARVRPAPVSWYVLARQSKDDGYDQITFSPTKDIKDAFCTLSVGEWSPRIVTKLKMPDNKAEEVFFRCKLIELSDDAEELRLYISSTGTTSGWSNPESVAAEIESKEGIIGHGGGVMGYMFEWFDLETFVEINELYTEFLADTAVSLLTKHEWDLFFMHAHSPDWSYHMILTDIDPEKTKDEAKRKAAWDAHRRIYQAQDKMLERIMQCYDNKTLTILISDHGAVADGHVFDLYGLLTKAGLSAIQSTEKLAHWQKTNRADSFNEEFKTGAIEPDVKNSKCFPQRTIYIYINLKGRDPDGIVDPKDYEKVQQQIIDALLTYVDPKTGMRPVALALSKRDARILGLYGDRVGDVIYALYPYYSGQHGNILPTAEWGVGSLKGLLTFTGPGIKKGFRLQRNCNLIDVVPTICYLMGLKLPEQTEGAVLYQALKNPNMQADEMNKLKAALGRMETALQRGERQPWDKHECA